MPSTPAWNPSCDAVPATIDSMCSAAPGSTSVTETLNGENTSRTHATTPSHTSSDHRNSASCRVFCRIDESFDDELSLPGEIVQPPAQRLRNSTFEKCCTAATGSGVATGT